MVDHQGVYDVTIIGGGPAGLYAAYYAGMRDMKTKLIEYLPTLGGTVSFFYPDKYIYDIGGIPKITGRDFIEQMKEQAMRFHPTLILGQAVEQLEKRPDGIFVLTGDNGEKHYSKTVIIAAGGGLFKVRRLNMDNADQYEDKHVHYEPKDLETFTGKRVMVYGCMGSAVERAVHLSKTAKHVTLVYHRDEFKVMENEKEQLIHSNVEVKTGCKLSKLCGDGECLLGAILRNVKNKTEEMAEIDDLIVSQGYIYDLDPVRRWGFPLENRRIPVNENMGTSLEGVYVAGDVAGYSKKWRLIASAFNETITAVNSAKAFIDPSAPGQVYSSILMG